MTKTNHFFCFALTLALSYSSLGQKTDAQQAVESGQFIEPIVRVTHEEAAKKAPQLAARLTPPKVQAPFNLTQRPGEHPLMPALRMAKDSLAHIDANIQDYSAILTKQERVNGELGDVQNVFLKVRHNPFGVYMFFLKPHKGRECLYNVGPGGEKGKLWALDCGWKRRVGKLEFDPEGRMAMKGQKYPIMKIGFRELTKELIEVATNDVQFRECEVQVSQRVLNAKGEPPRPVTLLEVTHPTQRRNFRFYKAQVFMDNELRIPIRYAAYMWPKNTGEAPPLEEVYTYTRIKINNGFTDLDFDEENPDIFKK